MTIQILNDVESEVSSLLSQLIKINTTNPPGNETDAARFLADYLAADGFQSEILESAPGRGSLITRLKGTGQKPNLLLLSHLDVVAANPNEWTVPPFSGELRDGFVYGRGAIDMKGMTAVEVVTLKLLKQNNVPIKGDVLLAATAGEETGGEAGAGFLMQKHKSKVWCPYVLNEGAGTALPAKKGHVFPVQTAEKGILWFKVKAKGIPGHGSTPNMADNALERINKVITTLGNYKAPTVYVPTLREFLAGMSESAPELEGDIARLLSNPQESDKIIEQIAKKDKPLAQEIWPRTKTTITPTIIRGGVKENIIPSECEVTFDCRVLPGQSVAEAFATIKSMLSPLDGGKLSYEVIQIHDGNESTTHTPLYEAITSVLKDYEPNCTVTPTLTTGGTDSQFFRREGSVCYGFHPVIPEEPNDLYEARMHGIDERLSVKNLVFGVSILYETVKRFMT